MPRGDGTGPAGMGPMTGRAAGYCAGYGVPGYMNPMPGYGRGMGWGGGRGRGGGRRNMYYATGQPGWARFGYAAPWGVPPTYAAPPTREQEVTDLQAQAEWLQSQLEAINERIAELGEKTE